MIAEEITSRRRPDLPLDLILAMLVDPQARAAEETLAAALFDPAFTAAVDAVLKETPQ